jgi:hypothetical protein
MINRVNYLKDPRRRLYTLQSHYVIMNLRTKYHYMLELMESKEEEWNSLPDRRKNQYLPYFALKDN